MTRLKTLLAMAAVLVHGMAQAALIDRGGGLIYDSDRNITWLADANYAKTSGYDSDGLMTWADANAWAAGLVFHDSVRNVDLSGWRLPTALNRDLSGPCLGLNCTDSELGHLYYIEGSLNSGNPITASPALNSVFFNMQISYWFNTPYAPVPGTAWAFSATLGHQDALYDSSYKFYSWAVRDGDVAVVPEAGSMGMLLAGLGLVCLALKRRRRLQG